jgi:glutamate-ammonia-ligase adenylyltransferase
MYPTWPSLELGGVSRAPSDVGPLIRGLSPEIRSHWNSLVATSPDPGQLRHYLASFVNGNRGAFERLSQLAFHRRAIAAVFAQSRFLSEEFLTHPEWIENLREDDLQRVWSPEEYAGLLDEVLDGGASALSLALFRRRQILRILLRDVFGLAAVSEVTEELSNLADAILEVSYRNIRAELAERHGTPRFVDGSGNARECGLAVIALGKLGGRELNYSSDIDLMFVYSGNGETDGAYPVSNKEFFKKLANRYTHLLSTYTSEGMCYRVDLRLRPDGSLGELCISLDGALKYYQTRARDWELQMLIKGRAAAGERGPGRELLDAVEHLIYSTTTTDFSAVEGVSVTRERMSEKLASRLTRGAGLDIKLAPGGIRDIEFLVQCLQRLHGGRIPWVRHGGTLLALSRVADKGLLSSGEHGRLANAYIFLRNLEHRLQFADDRQTHSLPAGSGELELIARRMPSRTGDAEPSAADLLRRLNAHLEAVQEIYQRVIHAQRPAYYSLAPLDESTPPSDEPPSPVASDPAPSNLVRFLDELAPRLARALAATGLKRGAMLFEHFLEKIIQTPDLLDLLDRSPVLARHTLDIFEHSRYFAEQLVRAPELIREMENLADPGSLSLEQGILSDPSDLRRSFRRQIFRIQAASICLGLPVFETLEQTSDLADSAIRAAYRMALAQSGPSDPVSGMLVIALGRLGMREFDLSSDADLIFVLPDEIAGEQVYWTRVASGIIDILSAYTGEGQLFAVDTRLRPNGGSGPLVQSESSFKEYFSKHAEAWEGLSYMKARAVAGDIDRATIFLNALQELDWRRYGQSGRSRKDLRAMRQRLEKEQGAARPLKAGVGGYYDIDFLLLYLRLKGAGIFFKVLNTPARIDVVEKMGHLDRADAGFLLDAAIFSRALDHGLRLYFGHTRGDLPAAEAHIEALTSLVRRWTPEHLHGQPLTALLAHFRHRTRDLFDHLFE